LDETPWIRQKLEVTEASQKLMKWLLFGVVVSTLPIDWAAMTLYIQSKPISLPELLGNGDLLMATCAGCAVAQGEVFGSDKMKTEMKILLGFLASLIVIGACLVFSSATVMRVGDLLAYQLALSRLALVSCILFFLGVIFGGFAVWSSERS